MVLEISQNSQENICVRVYFLIKLQAETCNFIKKRIWHRCSPVSFAKFLRGRLHVKFHPRMKLVPGWNHPCLWWNVSYCLHVFAEMKFHPGMKKRKKSCKHFLPRWNFKMSMKLKFKQKFFHPGTSFISGWDFISVTCKRTLRTPFLQNSSGRVLLKFNQVQGNISYSL